MRRRPGPRRSAGAHAGLCGRAPLTDKEAPGERVPLTSTVDRRSLVDLLTPSLADAAIAIEAWSDGKRSLDPDELVAQLRGLIADLVLELKASDLLDGLDDGGVLPLGRPAS